jgi:hypothetical protein
MSIVIRLSLVVLTWAVAAAPAAAQYDPLDIAPGPRRVDVSGAGGFLLSTDWSDLVLLGSVSTVTGTAEQVLARDLVIEPGPVFDTAVTYWEGRHGFRVHGGFARSCLSANRTCTTAVGPSSGTVDVNTYIYDVGGAVGLVEYRRNRKVWPYVFLGIGAVTYDLADGVGPPLSVVERRPPAGGATIVVADTDQSLIVIEELGLETKFTWNFGVGTDFRIPVPGGSIGVRLEVSDHLHDSPVDIEITDLEGVTPVRDVETDFGWVHNLRAAVGFVVQFGR